MCAGALTSNILDLPIEIVQQICNNLRIDDVLSLKDSCYALAARINSKSFWQRRLLHKVSANYPCFPGKCINWQDSCMRREKIMNWFNEESDSKVHRMCIQTAAHCIDAVHLFDSECEGLFACGDRGGGFSIFSLDDSIDNANPIPVFTDTHHHKGWIWTIISKGTLFATSSWDSKLRLWSLDEEQATSLLEFKMNAPVLSSAFVDENLIAAGTSKKQLAVYDIRAPSDQTALSSSFHQGAVICLKSPFGLPERDKGTEIADIFSSSSTSLLHFDDDDEDDENEHKSPKQSCKEVVTCNGDAPSTSFNDTSLLNSPKLPSVVDDAVDRDEEDLVSPTVNLYTGSEDQYLAAWDLRNMTKPIAKKHFATYPRAISLLDRDEMWVAASPKRLHVFRTCSLETFKSTRSQSYTVDGALRGFGAVVATPWAIFITGTPGSVDVLHPTMPPLSMTTKPLLNNFNAPPVSLSFANETLLIGMGNGTVQMWMSRQQADIYRQSSSSV